MHIVLIDAAGGRQAFHADQVEISMDSNPDVKIHVHQGQKIPRSFTVEGEIGDVNVERHTTTRVHVGIDY